mmetsp:Transcript_3660/g.8341  ORF Transcript_3660/g.8341 Transcript_3660/m.8341 type:complete len:317 (+) Transcript_3660:2-952(+)
MNSHALVVFLFLSFGFGLPGGHPLRNVDLRAFSEAIVSHSFAFVMLHNPEHPLSNKFMPLFEKTAELASGNNSATDEPLDVHFAVMDASNHTDELAIRFWPTLRLYRHGHALTYAQQTKRAEDILSWLTQHVTKPPADIISERRILEQFIDSNDVSVVCFFDLDGDGEVENTNAFDTSVLYSRFSIPRDEATTALPDVPEMHHFLNAAHMYRDGLLKAIPFVVYVGPDDDPKGRPRVELYRNARWCQYEETVTVFPVTADGCSVAQPQDSGLSDSNDVQQYCQNGWDHLTGWIRAASVPTVLPYVDFFQDETKQRG